MPFTIVAENCTGCTACEKRCPTKAITGDPKKAYYIEATLCIDCGACGVICPDEAILDTYGNVTKVLKRQERQIAIVHPDNCNGCGSRYTLAGDMLDVRNLACTLAACASPGPGGPDDFASLIEGTNRLAVERAELIVSSSQATLRFGR